MVEVYTGASDATFCVNLAHVGFLEVNAFSTENLGVKVSCTRKIVALLRSFCQQVTRADGHRPHYKYTAIFTLLAESGSRGTCCSPCSISASNTEL